MLAKKLKIGIATAVVATVVGGSGLFGTVTEAYADTGGSPPSQITVKIKAYNDNGDYVGTTTTPAYYLNTDNYGQEVYYYDLSAIQLDGYTVQYVVKHKDIMLRDVTANYSPTYKVVVKANDQDSYSSWTWVKSNGLWYLKNSLGDLKKGSTLYDGTRYYFDTATGAMKTGWFTGDDGYTRFAWSSGQLATDGWQKINATWYYFNPNGTMVKNKTVDGYTLGSDGTIQ